MTTIDYDKVLALKSSYIKDLFKEIGTSTLKSKDYLTFYKQNEEWLFPYACFSYFRDVYKTANFSLWKTQNSFDKKKLTAFIKSNKEAKRPFEVLNTKRLTSQSVASEYDDPKSRRKGTMRPEITAIANNRSVILL